MIRPIATEVRRAAVAESVDLGTRALDAIPPFVDVPGVDLPELLDRGWQRNEAHLAHFLVELGGAQDLVDLLVHAPKDRLWGTLRREQCIPSRALEARQVARLGDR